MSQCKGAWGGGVTWWDVVQAAARVGYLSRFVVQVTRERRRSSLRLICMHADKVPLVCPQCLSPAVERRVCQACSWSLSMVKASGRKTGKRVSLWNLFT